MTSALRVQGLSVDYSEGRVVNDVTLEVASGLTTLVGESGCGKTTLLRAVAGFERPASGTIEIAGETVFGPRRFVAPENRRVGLMFQEGALFPHLTVTQNVEFGVGRSDRGRLRVAEILGLVGLADLGHRYPDELSGGQRQRVALARALAPAPELLLLDEPFANLDEELRARLRDELRIVLAETGTTGVLVTHDREEALSVGDEVAVMIRGEIVQVGSPDGVYVRPASLEVAQFFGGGEVVSCEVHEGRLDSPFGVAEASIQSGSGVVFLRPEDLEVLPRDAARGAVGRLSGRRFYGHDCLDQVELEGGERVEVRVLRADTIPVGSAVRVGVRPGTYAVFPRHRE